MCDHPGPRPGIARKGLPLIAGPLADIIAKNARAQVAEATAQCKNAMVQQEQRLEELQAHIAQLQSAITCSASCFV